LAEDDLFLRWLFQNLLSRKELKLKRDLWGYKIALDTSENFYPRIIKGEERTGLMEMINLGFGGLVEEDQIISI